MSDNELLLAISRILDKKLKPLEDRQKKMEILLENDILPRPQNIEACYPSTCRRYSNEIEKIDAMEQDIAIMKQVIQEHSEKLKQIA